MFEILQKFNFWEELSWLCSKPLNLILGHMNGEYLVPYAVGLVRHEKCWHDISLPEDIISFANIDFGIIASWRVVVLCWKKNHSRQFLSRVLEEMFKLSNKMTWRDGMFGKLREMRFISSFHPLQLRHSNWGLHEILLPTRSKLN